MLDFSNDNLIGLQRIIDRQVMYSGSSFMSGKVCN